MAVDRYTGKDVKITFGTATGRFQSIEIHIMASKWEAPASDSLVQQRGSGLLDCEITLKGWESDATTAYTFDDVAAQILSGAAPSALSYTDAGATPMSRLPTGFFDKFPVSKWRSDDVTGGTGGPADPASWTVKLSPNNLDAPFSSYTQPA